MKIFRGRSGLSKESGESQLAWSVLEPPSLRAIATTHRLAVLKDGEQVWQRRWHEIESATWDREEYCLRVVPVSGDPIRLVVPPKGDLGWASTVRERIQSSVVTWRTAAVPGHGEVRLVVRQRHDRSLVMQVLPGPGVRLEADAVRAAVAGLRRQLRDELGQPEL